MNNIIYAYKKKDNNKIVYVGQTTDIISRHKQHIKYDPFNINNKEFDYPLSRGIRKYGEDMYELIILEDNLKKEQLNEREIYWIKFYNTYFNEILINNLIYQHILLIKKKEKQWTK